jgi:sRNA-binding regulator protein Hfq
MANSSHIPVAGLPGFDSETLPKRNVTNLQAIPTAPNSTTSSSTSLPVFGPRKLVRPVLPGRGLRNHAFSLHEESPILAHQTMGSHGTVQESTNAEAFYFQKQMQTQTTMIIVLEDGEQIEGCIEWYDRNAIKVRSSTRMLVYKAGIKYIYKAGESRS